MLQALKTTRILAILLCYCLPYIAHASRMSMHGFYIVLAGSVLMVVICWGLITRLQKR